MNVHVQRLYRARETVQIVLKRRISTGKPLSNQAQISTRQVSIRTTGPNRRPETLEDQTRTAKATSQNDQNLSPISSVHWGLADGYEFGGHIKRGLQPWQRHDENGMLTYGEWGIPIKFLSSTGPQTDIVPNFWLRDNCRCSKCVNQDTMQRAFDTFSLPPGITPKEVVTEKNGLRVTWNHEDHVSVYPWDWLQKHRVNTSLNDLHDKDAPGQQELYTYWGAEIKENPPSVHYDEIMADDKGVGKWTKKIREYGFCYVDGCPVSPEKTEELLERISFIRMTHYGGFYDFTSDLTMKDTAYTSLALGAHTDTTYFTDPAGLQMFHLLSHESGSGGTSLLVDGFQAACILKSKSKIAYDILSRTLVPSHASGNEGITITPAEKFPVLNFAKKDGPDAEPSLLQVRWNNDDRGVVGLGDKEGTEAGQWYEAARLWSEILRSKEMEYWAQLQPGRPLIFDNWRVLHGRSAFTGKRRICGGYINHDDFISRWRNTNFTREQVLKQIL